MKYAIVALMLMGCAGAQKSNASFTATCGLKYGEQEFRSAVEQAIDNALAWLPWTGRLSDGTCGKPPCFQPKEICDKLNGWTMLIRYDIDKDGSFEWMPFEWAYGVSYFTGPKAGVIEVGPQAFYTGTLAHEIMHVAEHGREREVACDPKLKMPKGGEDCARMHPGWYSRGVYVAAYQARVRR